MKNLLFSLILAGGIISGVVFAEEAVSTDVLLDYIGSQSTTKETTPTKTTQTQVEIENFIDALKKEDSYKYLNEEDEFYLTFKEGQTVDDFIQAIKSENERRKAAGNIQGQLPDPTIGTIQQHSNSKTDTPPLSGPAPTVTDPSQWLKPTRTNSNSKNPTNVPILDQIIPSSTFGGGDLNKVLNQLFWIGLVGAVVLALVMIIRGGVEYMTIDSISGKENGKKRVQAALGGLLLAFSAILILNTINPGLTKLSIVFPQLQKVDQVGIKGAITSGSRFDAVTGQMVSEGIVYRDAQGNVVIGGGTPYLDTDGSPGTYKVTEVPAGTDGAILINGKYYKSSGDTNLANAGKSGNWYGVKTDNGKTTGNPIINSDGTLIPQLSYGNGTINGEITPFVALSSNQLAAAKASDPNFKLGHKVLLTANGKTIEAIYADNAGAGRPASYAEVSPAAASALNIPWSAQNGKTSINNIDITITLP